MHLCLAHPTLGYYTTRKVFGSSGDFITSPEISQIFGELLAIWFVTQWLAQGTPRKVRVVELGPGKGTLLADVLRTFKALPGHSSPPVTSIHLIESSEALRKEQKKKLVESGFGMTKTEWWSSVDEVPAADDEFTVVIAHEFFDALPIHIFENTPKGWREVMVDVADPKAVIVTSAPKQPLRLVLAPNPTPASAMYTRLASISTAPTSSLSSNLSFDTTLPPSSIRPTASVPSSNEPMSKTLERFARQPAGSRMEISPASWEVARGVGKLLEVSTHGPITQSDFLQHLGMEPRLEGLMKNASPERKKDIESAAKRLIDPLGMGKEYKVMAITPKGSVGECFPFPGK
ncbi:DUF185 family protein [Pseudohyphozyma bogoriensis]|nr:DUF185 family protein [Pseudohyphozyma bogoriensis]